MTELICQNERRREAVRRQTHLFGLDYLEVEADQRTLKVYFLGKAPEKIEKWNVLIEGGRRIRNLGIAEVGLEHFDDPELDDLLTVVVDRPGDFSNYTLRIVEHDTEGRLHSHSAFDPRYDRVEFNFKVDCPSDLDCKTELPCPPLEHPRPEINYLAKDYASFKQLIYDRLALIMPDWRERHVPDLGVALVELLAYTGDYLSYYQDAVATEAYLETARQRISVRRHARLVDYQMHEGSNSRAWVVVETSGNPTLDPRDAFFVTASPASLRADGAAIPQDELREGAGGYEVFEPMACETIQLYQSHNRIQFYTWGDDECCLDRGALAATLIGELAKDVVAAADGKCDPPTEPDPKTQGYEQSPAQRPAPEPSAAEVPKLHLRVGDVLIFEELVGPKTGNEADADPTHRHAIRLTRVEPAVDPLDGTKLVEIEWAVEDALPFPLCLSSLGPPPACAILRDVTVARGNVILVDHGLTGEEDLGEVPVKAIVEHCSGEGALTDTSVVAGLYRPALKRAPLTFSQPLVDNTPASRSIRQNVREALPQVWLTSNPAPEGDRVTLPQRGLLNWVAQRDLLNSAHDDQHFVAEIENDGRARLRFGNDELGQQPGAGMKFDARYRTGNGTAGNVGAESILRLVWRNTRLAGSILRVRNPLPAAGGTAPEPLAEVRLFAPQAFRRELQRAIVSEDYAAVVQRDFFDRLQRTAATLLWNGSWYEALVVVDHKGKAEADVALRDEITQHLHRYRRIGHDVSVQSARLVPLHIELLVCVHPHYLRGHVKAALLDLFSSRALSDGSQGLFHPDRLSFGEGVNLSYLVAAAQAVTGVESVEVKRLERLYEGPNGEIEAGVLPLGSLEVAQLDNDPSFPEHGKLTLTVEGGR
jgi:hypothetical protein